MVTIKENTYTINTMAIGSSKVLVKNGKPVLMIPDELVEDFIQILTSAGACEKFLKYEPQTDSLPDKNIQS